MIQWMLAIWSLVPLPFLNPLLHLEFSVHVLLKPSWKDFEHYLASMWNEHNCVVVCILLPLPFFEIGMNTDFFQSCGHCWVFQIRWYTECSTLTALSFRIWNSSTGIPSPSLALFIVIFPKTHLTLHSRMSGSRWMFIPSGLSRSWRSF